MVSIIDGSDNFDSDLSGLKTVNNTTLVGSGDVTIDTTPPTAYNTVGTYTMARTPSSGTSGRVPGRTRAGSGLRPCDTSRSYSNSYTLSGTWRHMGYGLYDDRGLIYVRIS